MAFEELHEVEQTDEVHKKAAGLVCDARSEYKVGKQEADYYEEDDHHRKDSKTLMKRQHVMVENQSEDTL